MASVCLCNYSRACHLYNPDLLTVFLNTTVVKRCSSCDVERWISEMKLARVWEYLGEVSSKKIFHLNWSEGSWGLVWPTKIIRFSCRERMYKVLEYLYKTILVCPPSSVRLRYFLLIKTKIPVNRSGFISEIFLTPSIVVVIYPGVEDKWVVSLDIVNVRRIVIKHHKLPSRTHCLQDMNEDYKD